MNRVAVEASDVWSNPHVALARVVRADRVRRVDPVALRVRVDSLAIVGRPVRVVPVAPAVVRVGRAVALAAVPVRWPRWIPMI